MKNNTYWRKRALQNQKLAQRSAEDAVNLYQSTVKEVIEEIDRYISDLLATCAAVPAAQPPTRSQLWQAAKYMALRQDIERVADKLAEAQEKTLTDALRTLFEAVMEQTLSDFADGNGDGVANPFAFLPASCVNALINTAWSGKNYSARIWANRDALAGKLLNDLTDYIVLGKPRQQITRKLQEDFDVSFRAAERLIRTESAHIATEASKQAYIQAGVKQVKWIHGKGHCNCPICCERDGKLFPITSAPTLPAHPNCTCCIAAVVPTAQAQALTTQNNNTIINPNKYGTPTPVQHITITHSGKHADKRMAERHITLADAQGYVDNAIGCYLQTGDKKMYVSEAGVVIVLPNGGISTAYSREDFDDDIKKTIKELKTNGNV